MLQKCPVAGCMCMIRSELLMCRHHWRLLPRREREQWKDARLFWLSGTLDKRILAAHRRELIQLVERRLITQRLAQHLELFDQAWQKN